MMLLIDIDANPKTGWEGFDYLINRSVISDSKTWLEKNQGNFNWEQTTKLDYEIAGNQMQIIVPKSALGLDPTAKKLTLDFKWLDNCPNPGDIMQYYVNGDTAPDGRFKYRFLIQ